MIEPSSPKVLGVVLGNCVFNKNGHVCGKFFKGVFRNLSGEKVAMLHHGEKKDLQQKQISELMNQAWDIISNIEDHTCPLVNEREDWSEIQLKKALGW